MKVFRVEVIVIRSARHMWSKSSLRVSGSLKYIGASLGYFISVSVIGRTDRVLLSVVLFDVWSPTKSRGEKNDPYPLLVLRKRLCGWPFRPLDTYPSVVDPYREQIGVYSVCVSVSTTHPSSVWGLSSSSLSSSSHRYHMKMSDWYTDDISCISIRYL